MPTEAEAIAVVEEILEVPSGTVTLDADLDELNWDSLSDLSFISIADERFGIPVDAARLATHETVADLVALLTPSA